MKKLSLLISLLFLGSELLAGPTAMEIIKTRILPVFPEFKVGVQFPEGLFDCFYVVEFVVHVSIPTSCLLFA